MNASPFHTHTSTTLVTLTTALLALGGLSSCSTSDSTLPPDLRTTVYRPAKMKPRDSVQTLKVGDKAPNFTLPAVTGGKVSLADYRGRKNVVLSFVPASFTPVCSKQWPGYNISLDLFKQNDAELIGIATDNIPALHAWTTLMGGLDFKVLSDFWPHGKVSTEYGLLRSDGTSERAVVVIDKQGIIQYFKVFDINKRPALDDLASTLKRLN